MSVKQNYGLSSNHNSEDCKMEGELFTNPSQTPPECRLFDVQAHPSVLMMDTEATWKTSRETSTEDLMKYQNTAEQQH